MEYITFEQLKQIANNKGFTGNKVSIGIWAQINGFTKILKQINNKRVVLYITPKTNNYEETNYKLS